MSETSTDLIAYDQAVFPNLLDQDPDAVRQRFAKRFMAAETLDELFDVLEGNVSKDMVGRRLEIREIAWAPYESDRGIIPLAICQSADIETGEALEFATTGESLVLFLRRAELVKALPFFVRIVSKKTKQGRDALNFERVPGASHAAS